MSVLENIFDRAKARAARVVLPEIEDPRIAEAAQQLRAKGLADPIPTLTGRGVLKNSSQGEGF